VRLRCRAWEAAEVGSEAEARLCPSPHQQAIRAAQVSKCE
jgi:hypothetical protein